MGESFGATTEQVNRLEDLARADPERAARLRARYGISWFGELSREHAGDAIELWVKTEEAIAKEEGKRAADETMKKVRRWMKKRPAPREVE